ncbi:MAG: hypothetical protein IT562_16535 [Alphaproteobacteria bacterium]|nr:hypothetical protein [Alphaproteobacteria bacterium]
MRLLGAALAVGVAAFGIAVLLVGTYLVVASDRGEAGRPVPRIVVEESPPDRLPRISRDMTATMRSLQNQADEQKSARGTETPSPVLERRTPAASAPSPASAPRPPTVQPLPADTPEPAAVVAAPAAMGGQRPVSLVPYGRKREGRAVDARSSAAFDALVGRFPVSGVALAPQLAGSAPAAIVPQAQPLVPLAALPEEDLSNLTAEQLNEREHRRHHTSAGSDAPILPLQ